MTKLHKTRLLKLARFLDTLKPEQFDINKIREERDCGTVACACGWAQTAFPRLTKNFTDLYAEVPTLFGMTSTERMNLFGTMSPYWGTNVSPQQIAIEIRNFIKTKETPAL